MNKYIVRTRHAGEFSGKFIVGVPIFADSYQEAADKRFNLLADKSAAETLGLLVTLTADGREYGEPHLFNVVSSHASLVPA